MWHNKNKGAWMCIIDNRKRIEKVNLELGHEIKETLPLRIKAKFFGFRAPMLHHRATKNSTPFSQCLQHR